MNKQELIEITIELVQAILKSGGTSKVNDRTTTFEYKSLNVTLDEPHFHLTFMGQEVGEIKGWPYHSVTIDGKSYYFERNEKVPQDFIDHIAKSIDRLRKDIFVKTTLTPMIEKQLFQVYDIHTKRPKRETYLLKQQLINLFKQELNFHNFKRKSINEDGSVIYKRFLDIKNKLPHSVNHIRNPFIKLKKISDEYYHAEYKNGEIVVAGWGNDPYQTVRVLERQLREKLSDFGKNIHITKALRRYDNLFEEELDVLKNELCI